MTFIVCPLLPFPNIYWWANVLSSPQVLIDEQEHFEKMSLRNRYLICSANGVQQLSIPLHQGRQQRKPMCEIQISNQEQWQTQHWRSLITAYNRSPYFEFFAPNIEKLFKKPFDSLAEFSKESILLLSELMDIPLDISYASDYQKSYPEAAADIRTHFRTNQYDKLDFPFPKYHQTFEERFSFLPNLSALDLLFAEGKNAKKFLK